MSIFTPRTNLKPYEYPELLGYIDAIRNSFWTEHEYSYTSDIQNFHVDCTPAERETIKRVLLAISQIEVAVKTFWGDIGKYIPKPEVANVGAVFSGNEVTHLMAYSHLLDILGLQDSFKNIDKIPALQSRITTLKKALDTDHFIDKLILFTILTENISLFSQFLIIMSFNKYKNYFSGVANVVEATSLEENIHFNFGVDLINIIRKEGTNVSDMDIYFRASEFLAEEFKLIDWFLEPGELPFLSKDVIKAFISERMTKASRAAGFTTGWVCNFEGATQHELAKEVSWFDDELNTTKHTDFFAKRSRNYSKKLQSFNPEDLF